MIYLLFIILLALLFFGYLLNGRNIFSVGIISIVMYIISTSTVILNMNYFQTDISFKTVCVIVLSLILLCIGEFPFLRRTTKNQLIRTNMTNEKPIIISRIELLFINIILIIVVYYCFNNLFGALNSVGMQGDIFYKLESARIYLVLAGEEFSKSNLLSQSSVFTECLAIFCIYAYIYNKIYHNKKSTAYLLPVMLYILQLISSTGRTGYIRLIVVICIIIFIFWKDNASWSREKDNKIIKYSLFSVAVFLVLFRLFGYIQGTSQYSTVSDNFAKYIGSSIIGLDYYLNTTYVQSDIFGKETFVKIIQFLLQYGIIDIPYYTMSTGMYFRFGENVSNVYTGLRRSIADFTLIGMFVSRYLLGAFYGIIIRRLQRLQINKKPQRNRFLEIIIYGFLFYPITLTAIGDYFSTIFCTTFLYEIVYLYLINWYFIKRRGTWRKQALR